MIIAGEIPLMGWIQMGGLERRFGMTRLASRMCKGD